MNDLFLVFFTGLFGSLHCLGMCGPIILAYSFNFSKSQDKTSYYPHLLYNAGRIFSYTFAGALFGLIGKITFLNIPYLSFKHYAFLIGGSLMIIFGIGLLNIFPRFNFTGNLFEIKFLKKWFSDRMEIAGMGTPFLIGLFTIFLPCGLFYPVLLNSALKGDILFGALNMFFFAIGTSLLLFIFGVGSQLIGSRFRNIANYLSAASVILMGALLVYKSFKMFSMH